MFEYFSPLLTILIMHAFDLVYVVSSLSSKQILCALPPSRSSCEFGTGETGQWVESPAVEDEDDVVQEQCQCKQAGSFEADECHWIVC